MFEFAHAVRCPSGRRFDYRVGLTLRLVLQHLRFAMCFSFYDRGLGFGQSSLVSDLVAEPSSLPTARRRERSMPRSGPGAAALSASSFVRDALRRGFLEGDAQPAAPPNASVHPPPGEHLRGACRSCSPSRGTASPRGPDLWPARAACACRPWKRGGCPGSLGPQSERRGWSLQHDGPVFVTVLGSLNDRGRRRLMDQRSKAVGDALQLRSQ